MIAGEYTVIGFVVSTILVIITIIVTTSRLTRSQERRFNRLENGLKQVENGLNQVIRQGNGLLNLVGNAINLLHKKDLVQKDDISGILGTYTEMARIPEVSLNPMESEEIERLNQYIRKAKRGEFFSPDEVEDYNGLVAKLESERRDDPCVWPLVALGAFLSGLFLGTKQK